MGQAGCRAVEVLPYTTVEFQAAPSSLQLRVPSTMPVPDRKLCIHGDGESILRRSPTAYSKQQVRRVTVDVHPTYVGDVVLRHHDRLRGPRRMAQGIPIGNRRPTKLMSCAVVGRGQGRHIVAFN